MTFHWSLKTNKHITYEVGRSHFVVPPLGWGEVSLWSEMKLQTLNKHKVSNIEDSHHFQEFQVILKSQVCLHLHQAPTNKGPQMHTTHKFNRNAQQCDTSFEFCIKKCSNYRRTILAICSPLPLQQKRSEAFRRGDSEPLTKHLPHYIDHVRELRALTATPSIPGTPAGPGGPEGASVLWVK